MIVHDSMDPLPEIRNPVVTVGSFDGVHAGHRAIIARLNSMASASRGESVLVTFYPHPRKVLYPETSGKGLAMISTREEKLLLLEETGLDHLIILHFTRDFARVTSEDFVREYLVGKLHVHTIVVGFNHHFGHNQEGNYEYLYRVRERFNFQVEEIPEQEIQHETVSSTRIRKALSEGNIQRANAYLEHHFIMETEVVRSENTSALPGYLCTEVRYRDPAKLVPPEGTYAVAVGQKGTHRKGLLRIGPDGSICVFTRQDCAPADGNLLTFRFYKGMTLREPADLRTDMEAVRELIY